MKNNIFVSILFISLSLNANDSLPIQANSVFPSWMEHLVSQEVEKIELHTDLSALLERESNNDEYQDAYISYINKDDKLIKWELGVKPRGKYRRRICDFPPLKLNFSKKDLAAQSLASFDKYKLVTHCMDDRVLSKEAVIREYLSYQLYQELSPESFKVHLLRIRYVDTRGEYPSIQRYGFLIESVDAFEDRLKIEECEDCYAVGPESVNAAAENKLAVFQYMIGNTDFSLVQRRNLKLFTSEDNTLLIPVAYDFDFAALVGTSYAVPAHHLGQTSVADRVYLGFETEDVLMEQTLRLFENKKEDFFEIVRREKRLSLTARSQMKAYLNDFFAAIEALNMTSNEYRTYSQLRQTSPDIVPDGGNPLHYGVGR